MPFFAVTYEKLTAPQRLIGFYSEDFSMRLLTADLTEIDDLV
jgi:hypothetical protein